jgi:hypothetical protein
VLFEKIKSGNYDADDPIWENISDEAKDVVAKLLTVRAAARARARAGRGAAACAPAGRPGMVPACGRVLPMRRDRRAHLDGAPPQHAPRNAGGRRRAPDG